MESMQPDWRTIAVCEDVFAGPANVCGIVSCFWNQPKGRLQMEGTVHTERSARPPRWIASTALLAASDWRRMVEERAPSAFGTVRPWKRGGST